MKARLIVFPIKQRNWCFSRSIDRSVLNSQQSSHSSSPITLKDLWKRISSQKQVGENAELVVDFIANKMNNAWSGVENAPKGSFKSKIHGVGLVLLSRVKPSEIFLKSISKDVSNVEVTHPTRRPRDMDTTSSCVLSILKAPCMARLQGCRGSISVTGLNPHLVRRRLRHIAMRGTVIHRRLLYGSVTLLPFTSALAILPLPNVPFFWMLFRTYSHWRALQGSERLLKLVSNCPEDWESVNSGTDNDAKPENQNSTPRPWVLKASEELDRYLDKLDEKNSLSKCALSDICKVYQLDTNAVLKYKNFM